MLLCNLGFINLVPGRIHGSAENANGVITCSLTETMFQGWWIKQCLSLVAGFRMTFEALETQPRVKRSLKCKFIVLFQGAGWGMSLNVSTFYSELSRAYLLLLCKSLFGCSDCRFLQNSPVKIFTDQFLGLTLSIFDYNDWSRFLSLWTHILMFLLT